MYTGLLSIFTFAVEIFDRKSRNSLSNKTFVPWIKKMEESNTADYYSPKKYNNNCSFTNGSCIVNTVQRLFNWIASNDRVQKINESIG